MSNDTRYGFAIGRVRSLEARLLDRQQYDRLVRSRDAAEFRALLADTDYLRSAKSETGAEPGLPEVFADARAANFAFFARYCRDEWVLGIFRLRADAHNLKLVAKAALAGLSALGGLEESRLDYGRWKEEQLTALAEGQPRAKPERFRAAIATARARWEDGPDPAFLDAAVDRAAAAETAEAADANRFLSGYFARAADVQNLRALVRLKLLGEDRAALEAVLLPGGHIKPDRFPRLLNEDWDAIVAAFRRGEYERLMEQGIAGITESRSLLRFERLGRELELAWLARARYLTFGFEPLVSFFLFRENEVFNLQRLATAKSAGLPETDCAEMVAYA